jgi:hypothetical protein
MINYIKRIKKAFNPNNIGLTRIDKILIVLGLIPNKNGLVYDQIAFPDLTVKQIDSLNDFAGGFYTSAKLRRKSVNSFLNSITKGQLTLAGF